MHESLPYLKAQRLNPNVAQRRNVLFSRLLVWRYFILPLKLLAKFEGDFRLGEQLGILFGVVDCLQLVDIAGRIIRSGSQFICIPVIIGLVLSARQKGFISSKLPPILERLHLDAEAWLIRTQSFERHYHQLFSRHAIRSNSAA